MVVSLASCTFAYRRRRNVIVDCSLTFGVGKTLVLGPNGAGKSTILALAATALLPDAGMIQRDAQPILGRAHRNEHRRRVGWMPQVSREVPGMTVREQVALAGWLKGMPQREAWRAANQALEQVSMRDLEARVVSHLSGGQRARLGLAQCLVSTPDALLLDEPLAALDPSQKSGFRALISDRLTTRAIVVSTHDIHDVADTYDFVVVITDGQVRFDGSMDEFLSHAPDRDPLVAYAEISGSLL